ncbi:hypothetical protein E4U19_007161 [Claviceps sp. Clav32 group G5]|nr:hypothetical protein E4U19_007161 [Claviceps sp. Clav32 group G5]
MVDSVPSIQEAQEAGQKMKSYPPETSLTPVQISGKRQGSSPDLAAHNLPKRKKIVQTLPSVPARCSSRSRPSLQTLPVELLESIFLYSMDLALPRASPLLGAKLSAKSTRLRAFMMGFHDTWDQCFGIPMHEVCESIRRGELGAIELKDDDELQIALLSLPWVDIDFILEAQQAWADEYAQGRCYRHYEDRLPPSWEKFCYAGHPYHEHVLQHEDGAWKFNARACFEADYERARQYSHPLVYYICRLTEVKPYVPLPVELITGPWDKEKKRRLYWLCRGGQCRGGVSYNWSEHPWEVRLACLDAAVLSAEKPDFLILNCLIGPWLFHQVSRDATRETLAKLRKRIKDESDPPEVIERLRCAPGLGDKNLVVKNYLPEDEWNAKLIRDDDEK